MRVSNSIRTDKGVAMKKIQNWSNIFLFFPLLLIGLQKSFAQDILPTPVLNTKDTIFETYFRLTITMPESCTVHYTTNGTIPTRLDGRCFSSSIFTIDSSVVFTAKAFRFYPEMSDTSNVRWEDGGVARATYTKILYEPQVFVVPIINDSISVFMHARDWNSKIFYTIDGNEPDSSATLFTDVFHVPSNVVVKAIAVKSGSISSKIVTVSGPDVNTNVCDLKTIKTIPNCEMSSQYFLANGKLISISYDKEKSRKLSLLQIKNSKTILKMRRNN
jgi:hypothetical protein